MDDTFALDGGAAATRWKKRRARASEPASAPRHGGGRKKQLVHQRQIAARFSPATFERIERAAIEAGHSLSLQIALLCEDALDRTGKNG